jgi:tetratricopeptide (TPR) repeat protein
MNLLMHRPLQTCSIWLLIQLAFFAIATTAAHAQSIPVTTRSADVRRLFARGVDQLSNARLVDAESTFSAAVRADSTAAMPCALLAYLQHWELESGAALAGRAVRLARRATPAEQAFAAAVQALDAGDGAEVTRRASALRDQFPDSWLPTLLLFDLAFIQRHDNVEAERELRADLPRFPHNNFLKNALGYALRYQQKMNEARAVFEDNAREHADEPNPWDSLGNLYMAIGMTKEAIQAYEHSIRIDPTLRFPAYFATAVPIHLASAYVAAKRTDDAERALLAWLNVWPSEVSGYDALGEIYRRSGRLVEAAEQFDRALALRPSLTTVRDHLVRTRIEQGTRAFREAFRTRDAAALITLYTPTAQLLPERSAAIDGVDAIRSYWAAVQQSGLTDAQLQTTELYVGTDGKTATEVGRYRLIVGDRTAEEGKYIVVWQSTTQGWRIHRHMWTTDRPT